MQKTKYDDLTATSAANIDAQTRACIRLWAAVFHRGLIDAADAFRKGAEFPWITSQEKHPGSFIWLCDLFDMDPDIARSMARRKYRMLTRGA
jgi:hypothetical protein